MAVHKVPFVVVKLIWTTALGCGLVLPCSELQNAERGCPTGGDRVRPRNRPC